MKVETQVTDYQIAKMVSNTIEVNGEMIVTVESKERFRIYLHSFAHGKVLVTKAIENGQLRVNRIK